MTITEKDIQKGALVLLVAVFAFLVFLIIKPVILTLIGGLILAYIFYPVYKFVYKKIGYKNISASIVSLLVIILIVVPLWFLLPVMIKQVFEAFKLAQEFRITTLLESIFPNISGEFLAQVATTTNTAISKLTSQTLNSLVEFLINFPVFFLHLLLMAFVFFFTLRDSDKLGSFVSGLFPLNKKQEEDLKKQFEDITKSIIYGQVILGIVQGMFAGLGFVLFGVPNAVILTILAIILGIIPIIGPGLVYIPVTFYLMVSANPIIAIIYFAYNLIIVTPIDNILRAHILKRKARLQEVIALIGMVGGYLVFGILGLIIGPLILAYFITFLKAYKENTLSSFFRQ